MYNLNKGMGRMMGSYREQVGYARPKNIVVSALLLLLDIVISPVIRMSSLVVYLAIGAIIYWILGDIYTEIVLLPHLRQ